MSLVRPEHHPQRPADESSCAATESASQAAAPGPVLLPAEAAAGDCTGGPELADLGEADSRTILVARTARFTASFMRWMETRACDGMNYARLQLLQALGRGGPAIMRDLGTQLGVSPRNMTAIVDALEDARLVVRRPHPTDRRATLIELSPEGAREAEHELGPRLDAMSEIFSVLSPAEREQFSAILTKLMHAMRERGQVC